MAGRRPFALVYDLEVKTHLRAIDPKHRGLIRMTIEEQLRFEPDKETRNRKPLQRPVAFEATWEQILAIGTKERNRLLIGREEIKLRRSLRWRISRHISAPT